MNAPLRTREADRTYWQPLGLHAAADMGARVHRLVRIEWRTFGHHVARSGLWPFRVVAVEPTAHEYDGACEAVCAFRASAPRTSTWVGSEWMFDGYKRELAAERRAVAREEMRDYRRRTWREKSFQIE